MSDQSETPENNEEKHQVFTNDEQFNKRVEEIKALAKAQGKPYVAVTIDGKHIFGSIVNSAPSNSDEAACFLLGLLRTLPGYQEIGDQLLHTIFGVEPTKPEEPSKDEDNGDPHRFGGQIPPGS